MNGKSIKLLTQWSWFWTMKINLDCKKLIRDVLMEFVKNQDQWPMSFVGISWKLIRWIFSFEIFISVGMKMCAGSYESNIMLSLEYIKRAFSYSATIRIFISIQSCQISITQQFFLFAQKAMISRVVSSWNMFSWKKKIFFLYIFTHLRWHALSFHNRLKFQSIFGHFILCKSVVWLVKIGILIHGLISH